MTKASFLFTVVIAFYFGFITHNIPYFELDPKINIINLATLLVTVIIAFLIPLVLTKTIDNKKNKKNLINTEIDTLSMHLENISEIARKGTKQAISDNDLFEVKYSLKKARMEYALIKECIKKCTSTQIDEQMEDIDRDIYSFWELTTDDLMKIDSLIVIKDFNVVEKDFETLRKKLISLKILIIDL